MKTRILQTKIWKDPYFCELSAQEKLLFLYLLTNDKVNILHCYEITHREISFDTGIPTTIVEKICEKFGAEQRFGFYKGWVHLVNAYKYETYMGEKNELAKDKLLKEMSKDVLDWYNTILDRGIHTSIDTPSIPSIIHNTEIISHKREEFEKNIEPKTSKNSLEPCSLEELKSVALDMKVSIVDVKRTHEIILNKIAAREFKGKTVYHSLRNWILMGIERGTIKVNSGVTPGYRVVNG